MIKNISVPFRTIIACAMLAAAFCFSTKTAYGQTYTANGDVQVAHTPSGFYLGTLVNGEHFRRSFTGATWWHGNALGQTQLCGWVEGSKLSPYSSTTGSCGSGRTYTGIDNRRYLLTQRGYCVNDYVFNKNLPLLTYGTYAGGLWNWSRLYRNYYDGSYLHQEYLDASGTPIALAPYWAANATTVTWRYVTLDQRAIVVKTNAHPAWGFVDRALLRPDLQYSDGVNRSDGDGRNWFDWWLN